MAAIFAAQKNYNVTIFEKGDLLKTLLQTGNGRCNITYNEPDFKELTKFYPRGNKFLYSVFARFNVLDTINFLKKLV
ncbi:MAG: NAD(P)/FAD-dependent oxidoreductase [Candidatus Melainabacteria bacterium]|nr:MAG: NAD(P)/FAD-dependent oxidoreductase [Candidatus Melainabacteria bacterium]